VHTCFHVVQFGNIKPATEHDAVTLLGSTAATAAD